MRARTSQSGLARLPERPAARDNLRSRGSAIHEATRHFSAQPGRRLRHQLAEVGAIARRVKLVARCQFILMAEPATTGFWSQTMAALPTLPATTSGRDQPKTMVLHARHPSMRQPDHISLRLFRNSRRSGAVTSGAQHLYRLMDSKHMHCALGENSPSTAGS